jgi:hypothetical protein
MARVWWCRSRGPPAQAAINLGATASAACATAEDIAKNVAEGVGESAGASAKPGAAAHVGVDAGVAVTVIRLALLRVRQHFVGLLGLLELVLRALAIRIAVRMVLHCELAIGLLDVLIRSIFR